MFDDVGDLKQKLGIKSPTAVSIGSGETGETECTSDCSDMDHIVSHPPHYTTGNIEVIDYIEDKGFNFSLGNVIKYVTRAGRKGGKEKHLEDLCKAKQYLEFEIERVAKLYGED